MTHALGFAVLQEESRVVIIRFGHDWDQVCMQQDEVLSSKPLCFLDASITSRNGCCDVEPSEYYE